MTFPTKEEWLSLDNKQKQKAIADALFMLDFIYTYAKRIYRHTHSEGEIPHTKQTIKEFLKNTHTWEKELETLSKTTANDDQ